MPAECFSIMAARPESTALAALPYLLDRDCLALRAGMLIVIDGSMLATALRRTPKRRPMRFPRALFGAWHSTFGWASSCCTLREISLAPEQMALLPPGTSRFIDGQWERGIVLAAALKVSYVVFL